MINQKNRSLVEIHFAVFLFGLAGLFAKFLPLPVIVIVWGRVLFASLSLGVILYFSKASFKLNSLKDYFILSAMGIILAFHWFAFFHSIKLSTVAIGLLTFSTFPVFVTFIEPTFFKQKIKIFDIFIAFITFAGVLLIVPEIKLNNNVTIADILGVLSGVSIAVLSVLNKSFINKYSSLTIAFYEDSVAAIVLIPFLFFVEFEITVENIFMLMLLGVIFTAVAHTLFIKGMKLVKAQLASIIASLEPVYGVVFATLLLTEIPNQKVLVGGALIILATIWASLKKRK